MEKSKSIPVSYTSFGGSETAYNFNGPKAKCSGLALHNDPEIKRKKRVASYKVFAVEGKLKSSMKNSFRWLKTKYDEVRYGWG
ncbi:hypothetical protein SUGI_0814080 [Cryptomeria japonica]|nr:hypothetical protein SUGI_0814080 [Cryptomeria japonica]